MAVALCYGERGKAAALPSATQLPGAWLLLFALANAARLLRYQVQSSYLERSCRLALMMTARMLRCQAQSSCLEPGCPFP